MLYIYVVIQGKRENGKSNRQGAFLFTTWSFTLLVKCMNKYNFINRFFSKYTFQMYYYTLVNYMRNRKLGFCYDIFAFVKLIEFILNPR